VTNQWRVRIIISGSENSGQTVKRREAMKRATFLVLVASLLLTSTSCNMSPDTLQSISTGVLSLGLQVYSKSHPDQASKIATQMQQGADLALNYLNDANNSGVATTVLNAAVMAKLTSGLSADYPEIIDLIESAAGILDQVLPAPAPDVYLNKTQFSMIAAFVTSVRDSATNFNTKAEIKNLDKVIKAQKTLRPGKWFRKEVLARPVVK
jgi:hypothetical protein